MHSLSNACDKSTNAAEQSLQSEISVDFVYCSVDLFDCVMSFSESKLVFHTYMPLLGCDMSTNAAEQSLQSEVSVDSAYYLVDLFDCAIFQNGVSESVVFVPKPTAAF